jgi:hypothetical protein
VPTTGPMRPSLSADRARRTEPTNHEAPVRSVSGVAIGLPSVDTLSHAARRVPEAGLVEFFETPSPVLEVHFRADNESSIDCRPDLPLVFRATRGRGPNLPIAWKRIRAPRRRPYRIQLNSAI